MQNNSGFIKAKSLPANHSEIELLRCFNLFESLTGYKLEGIRRACFHESLLRNPDGGRFMSRSELCSKLEANYKESKIKLEEILAHFALKVNSLATSEAMNGESLDESYFESLYSKWSTLTLPDRYILNLLIQIILVAFQKWDALTSPIFASTPHFSDSTENISSVLSPRKHTYDPRSLSDHTFEMKNGKWEKIYEPEEYLRLNRSLEHARKHIKQQTKSILHLEKANLSLKNHLQLLKFKEKTKSYLS